MKSRMRHTLCVGSDWDPIVAAPLTCELRACLSILRDLDTSTLRNINPGAVDLSYQRQTMRYFSH